MRDLLIVVMVVAGSLAALKRPWIGVMVWTWLSIMNPHRFAWGPAFDAPLALTAAASTAIGFVFTRERESPFKGGAVTLLVMFMVWMTISWLFGLDVVYDYEQWKKIMKIDVMIILALMLLHTRLHIMALAIVATMSLALIGVKGGIFTITTGGNFHVWGPPGSFIEDNNEFALALVMTIPLLRLLQLQVSRPWLRHGLTASMLLCAVSSLGSQSRGALIAISAMSLYMWWRGKNKAAIGILMLVVAVAMIGFMPQEWAERMTSIGNYEQDASSMGRISAWWTAWNLAFHYPAGVGFSVARPELFALYSPYPDSVHAAHSIYFQVLGNHGFIGLAIFLGMWIATWRTASACIKTAAKVPDAKWCVDLGTMCQVSLVGYLVGGAFLSLSYFDLPYNILVLVVLTRQWLLRHADAGAPAGAPGRRGEPAAPRRPVTLAAWN